MSKVPKCLAVYHLQSNRPMQFFNKIRSIYRLFMLIKCKCETKIEEFYTVINHKNI